MANVVYGPFSAISITNGVTPINKTWGDNAQTQASVALNGINPLLSGPFVYSGIACTKDGTTANQLDIASGVAFATMSDGSTGQIAVGADNTHTTSTPSTTYYLFLKNDGTWQWSTTSTGPTNSLPICQATTDGSGNISAVTDVRQNAGSPGIPLSVARILNSHVTATTNQILLVYSVPVTGLYEVSGHFTYSNSVVQRPSFFCNWHDINLGGLNTNGNFVAVSGTPGQILNGSQASTMGNNQSVATNPISFYAQAGTSIGVQFQDPGGVPNDFVTAVIKRLS